MKGGKPLFDIPLIQIHIVIHSVFGNVFFFGVEVDKVVVHIRMFFVD